MKRLVSRHWFLSITAIVMIALSVSGILFTYHANAFTIFPGEIIYDPVSLFSNDSIHVHAMNNFGSTPFGIFVQCKPTSASLGVMASSAAITLNPGEGTDQTFPFAAFAPTAARIPVTCTVNVVSIPPSMPLPADFSGRLISSVEVIDDVGNTQMEVLGSRHILITTSPTAPPTFCLFCN